MPQTEQRNSYIKQFSSLACDSNAIGAAFSFGDKKLAVTDMRVIFVPKPDVDPVAVYKKINYMISSDISPESGEILSRETSCIIKKYCFAEDYTLTMMIAQPGDVPDIAWWHPLFDSLKLVDTMDGSTRVSEDELISDEEDGGSRFKRRERAEAAAETAVIAAEVEPEPEPEIVPEAEAEPVEAQPVEAQPEPAAEENTDNNDSDYWDFVAQQLKNVRHAISAGSFIRANEILGILRKMLIELICVRNGVEENFDTAIDYVDCEEKSMLIKTYPKTMNAGGLAAALGAATELFDRLA